MDSEGHGAHGRNAAQIQNARPQPTPHQHDRQQRSTHGSDQERADREPVSHSDHSTPNGETRADVVLIRLGDPHRESRQQQPAECVSRVVFQLDRIKRQPLAKRTQQRERRCPNRSQPPLPDHQRAQKRRNTEERGSEPQRQLSRAKPEQRDTFQQKPAERRALIEGQLMAQIPKGAIAKIQRDHLLVEPQGTSSAPLPDEQEYAERSHEPLRPEPPAVPASGSGRPCSVKRRCNCRTRERKHGRAVRTLRRNAYPEDAHVEAVGQKNSEGPRRSDPGEREQQPLNGLHERPTALQRRGA